MTNNARLIWGFDHPALAFDVLLNTKDVWFGDRRQQPNIHFDIIELFEGRLAEFQYWQDQGILLPNDIEQVIWERLDQYMNMYDRTIHGRDSSYTARRDYLMLCAHTFYTYLVQQHWDYALFIAPPHFGVDAILADLCVLLHIPVYYGFQSLFANRFFLIDSNYRIIRPLQPSLPTPVLPVVATEQLFYMQHIKPIHRTLMDVVGVWLRLAIGRLKGSAYHAFRRMWQQIAYQRQMQALIQVRGDLQTIQHQLSQQPYIYFPLHMQPEMTTSNLGGARYTDQVTAIEDLLARLPEGWVIVIKENPKQDWQCRSTAFWLRMMADPRVLLVDGGTPSKMLIQNSRLVATISGTVGWEAIRMGKPVIRLGVCWFAPLAGVKHLQNIDDLEAFSRESINQQDLAQGFDELMQCAWMGIIDVDYRCLLPSEEWSHNILHLKTMLSSLPKAPSHLSMRD